MNDRQNVRQTLLLRYAPLWAHLAVYALTCLIAAAVFYAGYKPAMALVEYFSGVKVPTEYSTRQATVLWALLLGAPALLSVGFAVAMRIRINGIFSIARRVAGSDSREIPVWIPLLLFAMAACIGAYDLMRAGAFARLGVWNDYGAWVEGRWMLFSTLGYFNFVNLYLIVPVSAAWVIIRIPGHGWKALLVRLGVLAIVVVLTFALFQKKSLIVSLIIIFGAMLLHRAFAGSWTPRLTWLLTAATGLLAAIYFFMVVLPIYSETSRTADAVLLEQKKCDEHSDDPCTKAAERVKEVTGDVLSFIGVNRNAHILAYALMAPMTRTSLPAMYYPIVFPDRHGYYGLDFGQDILGFGGMPDDNIVVWKNMYPDLPGAAGAPFQFVLYSQVGVFWTLLLCVLVGFVLGTMWQAVLVEGSSRSWRSLVGSIVVLFAIYLAIDSIRGGLLASYGLVWAWSFIIVACFAGRMLSTGQRSGPMSELADVEPRS